MGKTSPVIKESLDRLYPAESPSERTIRNIIKDSGISTVVPDTSEAWHWWDAEPEAADLSLRVLAYRAASGFPSDRIAISQSTGLWLSRFAKTPARELPGYWLDDLATLFGIGQDLLGDTTDLELFIAFAPWRNPNAFDRYKKARPDHLPPGIQVGHTYNDFLRIGFGFSAQAAESGSYEEALKREGGFPLRIERYLTGDPEVTAEVKGEVDRFLEGWKEGNDEEAR